MKKYFHNILLLLVSCLMIAGCTSTGIKQKITDHNWKLESVSDLAGNSLKNEMTITFNDDTSFVLVDKSNDEEWRGEYTTEKVSTDYKLDLYYEGAEEIIGVYGTREYADKTTVSSITFQIEGKLLSFIANE